MVGSLADPEEGSRPVVVVVPDLAVPIRHAISRLFQMLFAHRLHTRIQRSVVALQRQEVVHTTAAVRMPAVFVRTAVAVHILAAVVHKLVVVDHTAAAVVHIVVAAVDRMAIEEEAVHTELVEVVDHTAVAVVAEDDRKDSTQREIVV